MEQEAPLSPVQVIGMLGKGARSDPPGRDELLRRLALAVKRLEFHGARVYVDMLNGTGEDR